MRRSWEVFIKGNEGGKVMEILELEFEILANYLPFGLQLIEIGDTQPSKLKGLSLDVLNRPFCEVDNPLYEVEQIIHISEVKPILRPMSDISKEELSKTWENHVDYLTTGRPGLIKKLGMKNYIDGIPYSHFKYLMKYRFDLFGLIENGLAIDANEVEGAYHD